MAVETKVQASTGAAAVSGLALWSLGHWVFKGSVPDVVASWVYVIVPGVITFAAGYLAKHTSRPGALPPSAPSNVTVRPEKRLIADVSPLPDPLMQDLPGPAKPPAAPE